MSLRCGIAFALSALAVAGCGGEDAETTSADTDGQGAEATTATEPEQTAEDSGVVTTTEVERTLEKRIESSGGVLIKGPDEVTFSCPGRVKAQQGTKFTCRFSGDDRGKLTVTLADDQGTTIDYEGSSLLSTTLQGRQVPVR